MLPDGSLSFTPFAALSLIAVSHGYMPSRFVQMMMIVLSRTGAVWSILGGRTVTGPIAPFHEPLDRRVEHIMCRALVPLRVVSMASISGTSQ